MFLSLRFSDWSRTAIARYIRSGHIVSDTRALKPSSTLRMGEVLRIYVPGIAPTDVPPPMPPILYEDDHILAIDKPAGMLVHPVGQRWAYALIGIVRRARPDADIDLSHRLDRETSGVVILSKNPSANRHMKQMFMDRRVGKTYHALVRGLPTWDTVTCEARLGRLAGSAVELRRGAVAAGEGDSARTRFKVLARVGAYALVGCKPVTGRTHQLRAHLEHLGFPILGDKLYGQPDDIFLEILASGASERVRQAIGFPRQALHARAIAFPHPATGQVLRVRAPLPPDMRAVLLGQAPAWESALGSAPSD